MKQPQQQPAILIGGPPHAGKSVLTYSLTIALRQRAIEHYVLRACPDGEGHWSQEAPQQVAQLIRHKGEFTREFVQRVIADLARRELPLIVDVGGRPQDEQFEIFQHCTHAILLQKSEEPAQFWRDIVEQNHLHLLAEFTSDYHGVNRLESTQPALRGTLAGLERGQTIQGEPLDSLVERIGALFIPATNGLVQEHCTQAPTILVLNLPQILGRFAEKRDDWAWTPDMLPRLLAEVPAQTPFSVYGRAPHWIYSALLLHTSPAPFHLFDARYGWLDPLSVQSGTTPHPDITFIQEKHEDFTLLEIGLRTKNLDYHQCNGLHVPAVSNNTGLIISGPLPFWLASSLARHYYQAGTRWIAGYYPPLACAIVLASHVSSHAPGQRIPLQLAVRPT